MGYPPMKSNLTEDELARPLTAEEAVEKALLYTFQLSNKDYRKMQAAGSEVGFIRALEQDGFTVARADTAGIDAAWREVEAALPEGWRIDTLRVGRSYPHEAAVEWVTWAERPDYFEPRENRSAFGSGPTPAAALQALAARLREPARAAAKERV